VHAGHLAVFCPFFFKGFNFQHVNVFADEQRLPIFGKIRYNSEKRASYVMMRLQVGHTRCNRDHTSTSHDSALDGAARSKEEREGILWYSSLAQKALPLRIEATVAGEDNVVSTVDLVGDLQIQLVVAETVEDIDRYSPVLKTCRRRCLQALPAALQPLGLFSVRAAVRAALIE
jgi:hypothetical protein